MQGNGDALFLIGGGCRGVRTGDLG